MDPSTPRHGTGGDTDSGAAASSSSGIQGDMSAGPLTNPEAPRLAPVVSFSRPEVRKEQHLPIWMQRTFLVVYVLFCIEIGLVLSALPWTSVWSHNSLITSLPSLRVIALNNFVRGMITGMGLLDIWLGIWEAVHYRDRRHA